MTRINVRKLTPGMVIKQDLLTNYLTTYLSRGTVLTEALITRLQKSSFYDVDIIDQPAPANVSAANLPTPPVKFLEKYELHVYAVKYIFDGLNSSTLINGELDRIVSDNLEPMLSQSGIIDYLYITNLHGSYLYQHALRIAILSGLLAKWMHLSHSDIHDAMIAGLLHDIGKVRLDKNILSKSYTDLSISEKCQYTKHPALGFELLVNDHNISDNVKIAVMQHHEHLDRSGYPNHFESAQISQLARIVAITNKYDNLTSTHFGTKQETPFAALNEITSKMFSSLDSKSCILFIQHIKGSLLGSKVELSNNQTGTIAFYSHDDYMARPLICLENSTAILDLNQNDNIDILSYIPINL